MAYTLNREHQIFSLYPNNIKEIYVKYESIRAVILEKYLNN